MSEVWEPKIAEGEEQGHLIRGRGRVFVTKAPRDTLRDGSEIVGTQVRINGNVHTVIGLERYPMAAPVIRKGETIGLLVADPA
jgi:hypothetical protein